MTAPLTPRERVDGWAVMIEVNGETVLTIAHDHLSGIPDINKYRDIVLGAAKHLRSFIGAPEAESQLAAELEEANKRVVDLEQRDDITMVAFGKLEEKFKEQVKRAEAAERQLLIQTEAAMCLGRIVADKDADRIFFRDKANAAERQLAEKDNRIAGLAERVEAAKRQLACYREKYGELE